LCAPLQVGNRFAESLSRKGRAKKRATLVRRGALISAPTAEQEDDMGSSTGDKIKGATNEAVGKAKQGIGKAVDSDRMKGEGVVQEAKGHLQKGKGEAKEAIKKAIDDQ
jgi:uncharacterized protein YjbJ (UPF0337 family)